MDGSSSLLSPRKRFPSRAALLIGIALTILTLGIGCGEYCLFCDEVQDPCDPDPCANKENAVARTCTAVGESDYTCDCEAGTFWKNDGNSCEDPCASAPCDSIANAVDGSCEGVDIDEYTCDCVSGFIWDEALVTCVDDPCNPDPCQGIANAQAGSCQAQGEGEFTCQCQEDFFWDGTEDACKDPCESAPCDSIANAVDGSCVGVDSDNFTCECDPGHTWDSGTNTCTEGAVGTCADLKACLLTCNGVNDMGCLTACYRTWTGCDCELNLTDLISACSSTCALKCLDFTSKACWVCALNCGFDTQCQ